MTIERYAFEVWIAKTDKRDAAYGLLTRAGEGYLDLYVQLKWEGWKAAVEAIVGNKEQERRSDSRINQASRAAFTATEGLNPKGPEWL